MSSDEKPARIRRQRAARRRGSCTQLRDDKRGISEVYGSVLVIALAFVTAVVLVGLGSFVIQDTTDEFEDGTAQDAMFELDDRIAELEGETVDASTTFEFPAGSEKHLSSDLGSGQVRITVESTANERVVADTDRSVHTLDLGSIAYENSDGERIVYQGGGLWEQNGDTVRIGSAPPFDYDGAAIDFSFVSFSDIDPITDGEELSIQRDDPATSDAYEAFMNDVADHWRVEGENRTAPVDVTIEIESEFAPAWKAYAENDMTEPLSEDAITLGEDGERVTFEFENVGSEFELETDTEMFADGIAYAGLSDYIQYSEWVDEAEDGGFTVDSDHSIAVFDPQEGMWAYMGNPTWYYDDGTDDGRELTADERQRLPVREAGDGSPGASYEFFDGAAVCLAENDGIDDHLGDGDCRDLFGVSLTGTDDIESFTDEVTVDIEEVSYDGEALIASKETVTVEATVGNDGELPVEPAVTLADFDGRLVDSESGQSIDPGEQKRLTLEWQPRSTHTGFGDITVAANSDEDTERIQVESTEPEFEISEETLDIGPERSEGQTLTVTTTVENAGEAGEQTVWLERHDGTVADTEALALDAGERETIELGWELTNGDHGDGEIRVATDSDAVTEPVEIFRGAVFAGLATDAPFLTDRIESEALGESMDVEAGYPLDPVSSPAYTVYEWNLSESSWTEIDTAGKVTPLDTTPDDTATLIRDRAVERFGFDEDTALTTTYRHYELQPNDPVCFLDANSDLEPDTACGAVDESEPLSVSDDGDLVVETGDGTVSVLDTQIDRHEEESPLIRDPVDVAFLVDESDAMVDGGYETRWPHSGPAAVATEQLSNLVLSDPIAEIHDPRRLNPFSDSVTGGTAVYQEPDTANVVDRQPEADMLTTGYYLDYGTLEGLANDFAMHVRTDDGEWIPAGTEASSPILDERSPVAKEDIYYIWSGAVGIGGEVTFLDIDEQKDIRIQADTSDFPLVGSDEDEIGAQDPDGNRYTAVDAFAQRLFDSPPVDRAGDLYFTTGIDTDDGLTVDAEEFSAASESSVVGDSGDVDFAAAIESASAELLTGDDPVRSEHIVIVSAGIHGPDADLAELNERDRDALDAADAAAQNGQTIHTIALGEFADQWLLEELAERTGGSYSQVTDASDLTAAMNETAETELLTNEGYVRDPVAIEAMEFDEDGAIIDSTRLTPPDAEEWNANDPRSYNTTAADPTEIQISEILDGSSNEIAFEWNVGPCETGELARDGNGEAIEADGLPYGLCEPAPGQSETVVDSDAVNYAVYTDGDEVDEYETAAWQPELETRETIEQYLDDGEFDLGAGEAIVVAALDNHDAYEGYSVLHFAAEEQFESEDFAWRPDVSDNETSSELNTTTDGELELTDERLELTALTAQIGEAVDSSPFARPPLDVVLLTDQSSSMIEEFETVWPHSGEIGEAAEKWDDGEYITETTIGELEDDGFGLGLFSSTDVYHDWENCGSLITGNCDGVDPVNDADRDVEGYHINYGGFSENWVSTIYFRGEDGWIPFERDESPEALVDAAVDIDRDDIYYVETPTPIFGGGDGALDDVFFFDIEEGTDVRIEHNRQGAFGLIELLAEVDPQDTNQNRNFAIEELATQLNDDDRVSSIYFDSRDTVTDQGMIAADEFEAGAVDKESFFDDGVNLERALNAANDKLDATDSEGRQEVIVLLTDGIHAMGENTITDARVLDELTLDQAARAADEDRTITTVGLGPTADRWLLRTVSEEITGGTFYPVMDASDLQALYSNELADDITNDAAIDRPYTTITPVVDDQRAGPIEFGLADSVNVNDPETFNGDRSTPRSAMLDASVGLDETENTVDFEVEIASCEAGHAVDPDATLPDGERTYIQCTAPGAAETTIDEYDVYEDGDALGSYETEPWQLSPDVALEPYLDGSKFDLGDGERVLIAAVENEERAGYVAMKAQARPGLSEELPTWARAIDDTEFEPEIVKAQVGGEEITDWNEPLELVEGETVELTVNVTNLGNGSGQHPAMLKSPDGEIVDTQAPVFREPGESGNITLEWNTTDGDSTDPDSLHSLLVEIDGELAGQQVEVEPARPLFEIESTAVTTDQPVGLSDPVAVAVTVNNTGIDGDGPVWLESEDGTTSDITNVASEVDGEPDTVGADQRVEDIILEWSPTPGELAAAGDVTELTVRTAADAEPLDIEIELPAEDPELVVGPAGGDLPPIAFEVLEAEIES